MFAQNKGVLSYLKCFRTSAALPGASPHGTALCLSSVCANRQVTAGGSKGSLERFSIRMADGETNGGAIIKVRINLLKYQSQVPLATLGCFTWPPPSSPKQCRVYSLSGTSPKSWCISDAVGPQCPLSTELSHSGLCLWYCLDLC